MPGFKEGYALIIGIANYPKVRSLPATVLQDARDIYDLLRSPSHCGYPDANIRLLLDGQGTAAAIRAGLHWLAQSAVRETTALVFFSGHGGRIENGSEVGNYIIPYDCDPTKLAETAISGKQLTDLLQNIQAQRLLVLFDCCYSGGTGEPKGLSLQRMGFKSGLEDLYYERLAQGTGRVIMASSRENEVSLVLPGMKNSLFTHYFLEALRGNARSRGDGLIRVFDIFDLVSEEVPARGPQHPIFKAADLENNFAVALYLGGKQTAAGVGPSQLRQTSVDKRSLREMMTQAFSLEELGLVCADVEQDLLDDGIALQVNLETIGGSGKPNKVLELINYLYRRGYLLYLVRAVRRHRPGLI